MESEFQHGKIIEETNADITFVVAWVSGPTLPINWAAGPPAGRPAGERAGLVDFYSYKTPSTQLQDSLGSTLYTSPNKKTV